MNSEKLRLPQTGISYSLPDVLARYYPLESFAASKEVNDRLAAIPIMGPILQTVVPEVLTFRGQGEICCRKMLETIQKAGVPLRMQDESILHLANTDSITDGGPATHQIVRYSHRKDFRNIPRNDIAYDMLWKLSAGPKMELLVGDEAGLQRIADHLVGELLRKNDAIYNVKQTDDGIYQRHEFKLNGRQDKVFVDVLGYDLPYEEAQLRSPTFVIERRRLTTGTPSLRFDLEVDTNGDAKCVREYSKRRTLFSFEITPVNYVIPPEGIYQNRHSVLSWDINSNATWQQRETGPYVQIPIDTLSILGKPMSIAQERLADLEKHPLELVLTASHMLYKAVVAENNIQDESMSAVPAIDSDTLESVNSRIAQYAAKPEEEYNAIQDIVFEQAKAGRNVIPDLLEFNLNMIKAINHNPSRFWRYFTALGLHRLIPALDRLTEENLTAIGREMDKIHPQDLSIWDKGYRFVSEEGTAVSPELLYENALLVRTSSNWMRTMYEKDKELYLGFRDNFIFGLQRLQSVLSEYAVTGIAENPLMAMSDTFSLLPDITRYKGELSSERYTETDIRHMRRCLRLARQATKKGEEPFGCVIVDNKDQVIAEAHNEVSIAHDPTNHAEVLAIRRAIQSISDHTGENFTLYVNCGPCPMCAYVIREFPQIKRVVYGAHSLLGGDTILLDKNLVQHGPPYGEPPQVVARVLENEAVGIFKENGYKTMVEGLT